MVLRSLKLFANRLRSNSLVSLVRVSIFATWAAAHVPCSSTTPLDPSAWLLRAFSLTISLRSRIYALYPFYASAEGSLLGYATMTPSFVGDPRTSRSAQLEFVKTVLNRAFFACRSTYSRSAALPRRYPQALSPLLKTSLLLFESSPPSSFSSARRICPPLFRMKTPLRLLLARAFTYLSLLLSIPFSFSWSPPWGDRPLVGLSLGIGPPSGVLRRQASSWPKGEPHLPFADEGQLACQFLLILSCDSFKTDRRARSGSQDGRDP